MENNICELVRKNEQDYIVGNTTISKYVDFSLSDTLNTIDAYLNSKHISGATDSQDREKPFFDICSGTVNIWYRATDIDRKHIRIRATKESNVLTSYVGTAKLHEWMRKDDFGTFLNDWGLTLSRYGSAVCKFIENDDGLHSMVVPFNRLIIDAVDMDNDVVIEILELTPAQLKKKKGYDQEIVNNLIDAVTARETKEKLKKDEKDNFIKVYEVHGELPLSYLTGKEKDNKTYVQQMHVISFVADKQGKYDDFTLVKGREEKNPYMITHLIKEDGRSIARGAVERLFQNQWMTNHTAKQIKDQLDTASKIVFQTSDGTFMGQNALTAIDNGDILIHALNQPLTQVANNSHDITAIQNFHSMWKSNGNEITGISESMLGITPPSGTAWRQTEALLQESHDLFELMRENKGLAIERMLRTYVLPHIKKQLDNSDEISAMLDDYGIQQIEKKYIKAKGIKNFNGKAIEMILNGEVAEGISPEEEMMQVQEDLKEQGSKRFLKPSEIDSKTWKEIFKDFEWDVEVDVTGEASNDKEDMATLATMFQVAVTNPQALQDPYTRWIFNKILIKTGTASPVEIAEKETSVTPQGGSKVGTDMSKLVEQQEEK